MHQTLFNLRELLGGVFCHEIYPATCHEIYLAIKNYSKSHGHPEFALGPPRGGGPDKNFETS